MSLKAKFIMVGSVFIIFTLIVSVVQMQFQKDSAEDVQRILDYSVYNKVTILEINRDLNYISRLTRNIMLGSGYDKDMEKFRDRRERIESKFESLIKNVETDKEVSDARNAKTAALAFIDKCYEIVGGGKDIPKDQRYKLYDVYKVQATPLAVESRKYFGSLIKSVNLDYEKDIEHFFGEMRQDLVVSNSINIVFVFIVVGLLALMYLLTVKPLWSLVDILKTLTNGDGDLSARMPVESKDPENEKGAMKKLSLEFNKYLDNLDKEFAETMYLVGDAGEHTMPVSTAIVKVRDAIENNVEMVTQIATAGDQMSATINEIAMSAQDSAMKAEETVSLAQDGGESIELARRSSENVSAIISDLEKEIENLTEKATEIGGVISVINDISEQTNLLALNAAIEAARAGEAGRGFAVVADEVRKLAEKTQSSTKEIENMVGSMTENIDKVNGGAQDVVSALETQSGATNGAYENFQTILNSIQDLNSLINGISAAVTEQSASTQQIMASISGMADNSESTRQTVLGLVDDTDGLINSINGIANKYSGFNLSTKAYFFAVAKIAHINMMKGIFDCYSKGQCSINLPDFKTCKFGQFYYGEGMEIFGTDPEYKAMEAPHKMVHVHAQAVLDGIKSGNKRDYDMKVLEMEETVKEFVGHLDRMIQKYK
jgi:methyl-accepting chemotaxis protein